MPDIEELTIVEIMEEAPSTLEELHVEMKKMPPEHQAIWEPMLSRLRKMLGN
jgi:hypothetical protein